jgi:hypothetical protein
VGILAAGWSVSVLAYSLPCDGMPDPSTLAKVLKRIRLATDPCGESPQVVAMLDKLERCATDFRICTNLRSERNSFDRPVGDRAAIRTITWNPRLRTIIERGCDGDPGKPVRRDATASLLHELAHAAQDCDGLDPNAHEFDAVRIENIYRRAVGLCQRTRYGEDALPPEMITICDPGHCLCVPPAQATSNGLRTNPSLGPQL